MQNNQNTYLNPNNAIVNPFSRNNPITPLIKSQAGSEYTEFDEEYDYKIVDGQWVSKRKGDSNAEWKDFGDLSPEDRKEAENKLNEAYPDSGFVVEGNEDEDPNKEIKDIAEDSGLELNKKNLGFVSPDSGTINSPIGDTGILDLVKAIDTTYKDFKPENYYDSGTKADYAKFSHTNTTDEGLYVDEDALAAGKKTGDVLGSKEQIHERSMQKFLDQRHDRNPNKYGKVDNFESDIYDQTGYLNYRNGPLEGDTLENTYSDATDIGWNLNKEGNYDQSFDYLTANEDGETFDQQSFEVGSDEYNTSVKHNPEYNFSNTKFTPNINTNMNLEDDDPYAYAKAQQQMYGGSPHLQYGGNLPEFGWGSDLYNWGSNKASQASNYISENASGIADGLQTGLSAVGMIPGIGNIADAANTAISGGRAAYAGYTGDTEGAKKHIAAAGVNALAMLPGIGQMATAGKIADKATDIYSGAQGIGKTTKMLANAKKTGNIVDGAKSLVTDVGSAYNKKLTNMMDASALEGTAEMLALGKKADFTTGANAKSFAQNSIKNDAPSATDLALDDTLEVDDEQSIGAWGLETPRRLKKMQMAGSVSGYNPLGNQRDPLNLGSNPFNSEMLDIGAADFTAPDLTPYFDTADQMYAMNQSVQRSMDSYDAFTADMNDRISNPSLVQVNTQPLATIDPGLLNSTQRLADMSYSRDARQDNRVMEDGTIIKTPKEMQATGDKAIANMQEVVDRNKYQGTQENLDRLNKSKELGFKDNQGNEGSLTKLDEYEKSENLEGLQNTLREDKLNEDNKDSNQSFGDRAWNAKNRLLDSKAGQTYGKIGAGITRIAKPVNRLLEMRNEREQKKNMKNAYLSDNLFATREGDISGSKGDYDVNSGIFRPDDKVVTRQGKYGAELTNQLYKAQNGFWDGVKNVGTYAAENLTPVGGVYQAYNYAKDLYDGESLSNVGNNILDDTQSKLGVAGNIIGPGDIADGVNSGISLARGYFSNDADAQAQHYKNAAVSAESIVNPVLGAAATMDDISGGVTSLTDYAGVTPNVANYAIGTPSNTQASNTIFADNFEDKKESNLLRRGGSFFNDGGEAEIDINMYKELIAAGADLEII